MSVRAGNSPRLRRIINHDRTTSEGLRNIRSNKPPGRAADAPFVVVIVAVQLGIGPWTNPPPRGQQPVAAHAGQNGMRRSRRAKSSTRRTRPRRLPTRRGSPELRKRSASELHGRAFQHHLAGLVPAQHLRELDRVDVGAGDPSAGVVAVRRPRRGGNYSPRPNSKLAAANSTIATRTSTTRIFQHQRHVIDLALRRRRVSVSAAASPSSAAGRLVIPARCAACSHFVRAAGQGAQGQPDTGIGNSWRQQGRDDPGDSRRELV